MVQINLGVENNFGHGIKCDALYNQCLVELLMYEVQVPNVRIDDAQVDKRSNNNGNQNSQVGSLLRNWVHKYGKNNKKWIQWKESKNQ